MKTRLDVFSIILALANVLIMVELFRQRRVREKFALLWITVGLGGVVLAIARPVLDDLSHELGIVNGTSFLFLLALMFLLFVCVALSLQVSRLEERTEILAEELGLLRGDIVDVPHR
jgi:hypothetical protein